MEARERDGSTRGHPSVVSWAGGGVNRAGGPRWHRDEPRGLWSSPEGQALQQQAASSATWGSGGLSRHDYARRRGHRFGAAPQSPPHAAAGVLPRRHLAPEPLCAARRLADASRLHRDAPARDRRHHGLWQHHPRQGRPTEPRRTSNGWVPPLAQAQLLADAPMLAGAAPTGAGPMPAGLTESATDLGSGRRRRSGACGSPDSGRHRATVWQAPCPERSRDYRASRPHGDTQGPWPCGCC